jgi:hypothetical protein
MRRMVLLLTAVGVMAVILALAAGPALAQLPVALDQGEACSNLQTQTPLQQIEQDPFVLRVSPKQGPICLVDPFDTVGGPP